MNRRDFLSSFLMGLLGGICALFGYDFLKDEKPIPGGVPFELPKEGRVGSILRVPAEYYTVPEPGAGFPAALGEGPLHYDELVRKLYNPGNPCDPKLIQQIWDLSDVSKVKIQ